VSEPSPVTVGVGVTYYIGGDAYPYVVVEADPKRKSIVIARVEYHVVSGSEQTGDAVYAFGEKRGNQTWVISPSRKKADAGKSYWRFQGGVGVYIVGEMHAKRDPSF
jgi:hypothetical protein